MPLNERVSRPPFKAPTLPGHPPSDSIYGGQRFNRLQPVYMFTHVPALVQHEKKHGGFWVSVREPILYKQLCCTLFCQHLACLSSCECERPAHTSTHLERRQATTARIPTVLQLQLAHVCLLVQSLAASTTSITGQTELSTPLTHTASVRGVPIPNLNMYVMKALQAGMSTGMHSSSVSCFTCSTAEQHSKNHQQLMVRSSLSLSLLAAPTCAY